MKNGGPKPNGRTCQTCGRPLIGRQRHHCRECAIKHNRRRSAEHSRRLCAEQRRKRRQQWLSRQPRTCLACGGEFMSEGAWNRICPACGETQTPSPGRCPLPCSPAACDDEDRKIWEQAFA